MKALVGRHFQPGEGPSRGLLRDCTTGCGTDGALHSTIWNSITHFIFPTFYIPVPESATARVGSKFLAPATNTSSIFYDNVDNFHADVNGTWINKFARN